MIIKDHVSTKLKQADSLPFLFVGSGISRRYLDLPDWQGLLDYVANLVYSTPFEYAKVKQSINDVTSKEQNYNLYMTKLCDAISIDLNEKWFTDTKFAESRREYSKEVLENGVPPMKIEIAKYIKSFSINSHLNNHEEEIQTLKQINNHSIAGIITTNYDGFLESIFQFVTYSSQEELLFRTNYEVGEIYKIHGSTEFPNSIKINSKDYEEIEEKNKYLAAKLLTIFVEHPIFFIGYSLNDEDVKQILENIIHCLNKEQIKELQDRMFYIHWDSQIAEPSIGNHSIAFQNNVTLSMPKINLNSYTDLFKAIGENKSQLPVQALRKLKHQMYDLALTTEGNAKIQVQSVDKIITGEEFEIIAGFGIFDLARRGYKSITSEEIFKDIIFSNGSFNSMYLVNETLPRLLPQSAYSIPIYKYIKDFTLEELPPAIVKNLKTSYKEFIPDSWNWEEKKLNCPLVDVLEIVNDGKRFREIAMLSEDLIDIYLVENHIKDHITKHPDAFKSNYKSDIKRVIKIIDWLKYGKKKPTMESVDD